MPSSFFPPSDAFPPRIPQGGRIPHPSIIWARRAQRLSGGDRSRCTIVYAYAIDVRPPPICVRTASFVAPVGTSPSSSSFRPRLNIAVNIGVDKNYFRFQKRNNETNAKVYLLNADFFRLKNYPLSVLNVPLLVNESSKTDPPPSSGLVASIRDPKRCRRRPRQNHLVYNAISSSPPVFFCLFSLRIIAVLLTM